MIFTEETDDYMVASSCPVCKQVGYHKGVLLYKVKDLDTGEWDGKLLKCGMCNVILEIR